MTDGLKLKIESKFPDILKKENIAEKQANRCDPHIINTIVEIYRLLYDNRRFTGMREYDVLKEDADIIKKDFVKECICKKSK